MLRVFLVPIFGLVAASAALSGTPPQESAPALDPVVATLPEGDGRELTAMLCTQCHAIGMVTNVRHARADWEDVIVRMQEQGFYASEEDTARIVDYLSTHFAPES